MQELGPEKFDYVAVYAKQEDRISVNVEIENLRDRDSQADDMLVSINDRNDQILNPEKDYKQPVKKFHNFKEFKANYDGFYTVFLDNNESVKKDEFKTAFIHIRVTESKTSEVSYNMLSIVGPILIDTSAGMFAEITYAWKTGKRK